jgi:hypothetical protein
MEAGYIMEKVNERRRFVKGIGFFAAILGGGSALGAANSLPVAVPTVGGLPVTNGSSNLVSEPVVEDISHLAPPENATTIQFTGAYGQQPKHQVVSHAYGDSIYINGFTQETTHKVSMTVGLDNRLWIKVGDTWKRVAIEG